MNAVNKTWIVRAKRKGEMLCVPVEAPTRKLALQKHLCGIGWRDEVIDVSVKRNN